MPKSSNLALKRELARLKEQNRVIAEKKRLKSEILRERHSGLFKFARATSKFGERVAKGADNLNRNKKRKNSNSYSSNLNKVLGGL